MSEFNTEPVRVRWSIETGFSGGSYEGVWEFGPGDLPTDPEARETLLEEYLRDEMSNCINAGFHVEEAKS